MANITTTTPPENLTGWTVTVPPYWTAGDGWGQFSLEGIISSTNFTFNALSFDVFNIGYVYEYGSNRLVDELDAISCPYVNLSDVEEGFTLKITGGSDASYSYLIRWFVNNNATFEKTGGEEETPDTPEEPTVTSQGEIYYDGNLVDTLIEGEFIVLHAKDFKFIGDIVIKNVGEVEEETPTTATVTITVTEDSLTGARFTDENFGLYSAAGDGTIDNGNPLIVAVGETKTLTVPVGSVVALDWIYINDFGMTMDGDIVFSGDCSKYPLQDAYTINGDTTITVKTWDEN